MRTTGSPDVADEAVRVLPDPVHVNEIAALLAPYAITLDELINRMGGSP